MSDEKETKPAIEIEETKEQAVERVGKANEVMRNTMQKDYETKLEQATLQNGAACERLDQTAKAIKTQVKMITRRNIIIAVLIVYAAIATAVTAVMVIDNIGGLK